MVLRDYPSISSIVCMGTVGRTHSTLSQILRVTSPFRESLAVSGLGGVRCVFSQCGEGAIVSISSVAGVPLNQPFLPITKRLSRHFSYLEVSRCEPELVGNMILVRCIFQFNQPHRDCTLSALSPGTLLLPFCPPEACGSS